MRIILQISLIGLVLLSACKDGGKLAEKKGQLDKIKGEIASLETKAKVLEEEIAKLDTSANTEQKSKIVALTEIVRQSFRHYIDIHGRIDADENVMVSPKMPGTVSAVYVKTGDMVQAGQVLAQLDDKSARQSLEEMKKRMELAGIVYEKQKNLWDQKIGSEIAYLQAKNNKESLDKALDAAKEQIENFKVKALVSGVVDAVDLKVGQMASPGITSIRVVNNSKLKVKAEVAETYAAKVHQGNSVMLFFPDLGTEATSSVTYASKVISPMTRTFTVEALLPAGSPDYRPNMVAVLKIIDFEDNASMVVPINTVQNSEEGQYVYVATTEKNKTIAAKRMVETGLNYGGKIVIKSGLQLGDKLITTGYQDLNDGQEITVAK
jgi:RND family efflux transporter MFP subunit